LLFSFNKFWRKEVRDMQRGNTLVIALVIAAILLVGGVAAYFMTQNQNNTAVPAQDASMEEAMVEKNETMMEEGEASATDQTAMDSEEVTVDLSAENFSFSATEIRVKRGDTVTIVLDVTAGMHDFVIDEFDARTKVVTTGETDQVTFVADEAGEFEYYCSVGNHRQLGMVGTLIVE